MRAGGRRTIAVESPPPPPPPSPSPFCFVSLHGQVSMSWCLADVDAACATNSSFYFYEMFLAVSFCFVRAFFCSIARGVVLFSPLCVRCLVGCLYRRGIVTSPTVTTATVVSGDGAVSPTPFPSFFEYDLNLVGLCRALRGALLLLSERFNIQSVQLGSDIYFRRVRIKQQ